MMIDNETVKLNTTNKCEVCGSEALTSVINLGYHAMCDDLVCIGDSVEVKKFPIEILFCSECKTAHQKYQIPKKVLFPRSYHYRSSLTQDVLKGMAELVHSYEVKVGKVSGKKVLDIGCNDGSLLSIFKEKGALTYGVEPTDAAVEALSKGHTIVQGYFSIDTAMELREKYGQPEIITFTNVFAHIENLHHVLDSLIVLMSNSTDLIIENHYMGSVLDGNQFDTFYHEHPRTYSYSSFKKIAQSLQSNISAFEFPKRYGGNIRVFLTRKSNSYGSVIDDSKTLERERRFQSGFLDLSKSVTKWQSKKKREIVDLVRIHGPLRAKAFPGRAAILLELLGLSANEILAVYEQHKSSKIGCYVPGTRIPIISDNELDLESDSPIINLAWHIQGEIESYLRKIGFKGDVLPIVSDEDFI